MPSLFSCSSKKKKKQVPEEQKQMDEPKTPVGMDQSKQLLNNSAINNIEQFHYPIQEARSPPPQNYDSNIKYMSLYKMTSLDLKSCGLSNAMFYCYMNAALQCLLSIGQLNASYFDQSTITRQQRYSVAYYDLIDYVSFHKATKQICKHREKGYPVILHTKLQKLVALQFNPYDQHDAHEFLLFLLSKLQEEAMPASVSRNITFTNPKKALSHYCRQHTHIVDQIFMGQLTTAIHCSNCQQPSMQFESFFDVSVPIEPNCRTIYDCLGLYFKDETIEDELHCDSCNQKSKKSIRRVRMTYPPNMLVIQLKRFHIREKIKQSIEMHLNITLSTNRYVSDIASSASYQLKAIIIHKGTVESGHYVAIARKSNKVPHSNSNQQWYHYDDEEVTPIQQSDVEQVDQAYVLFYEKLESF